MHDGKSLSGIEGLRGIRFNSFSFPNRRPGPLLTTGHAHGLGQCDGNKEVMSLNSILPSHETSCGEHGSVGWQKIT
jgi:hypothetical protein